MTKETPNVLPCARYTLTDAARALQCDKRTFARHAEQWGIAPKVSRAGHRTWAGKDIVRLWTIIY